MPVPLSELARYPIEIRIIVARGLYGAVIGLLLSILAVTSYLNAMTLLFFPQNLASYFTWIYLALLYIPSIFIAKQLGATRRFDLYLRGISSYFALAVLTHIIIAST